MVKNLSLRGQCRFKLETQGATSEPGPSATNLSVFLNLQAWSAICSPAKHACIHMAAFPVPAHRILGSLQVSSYRNMWHWGTQGLVGMGRVLSTDRWGGGSQARSLARQERENVGIHSCPRGPSDWSSQSLGH